MLEYIQRAIEQDYGVVVLNPNANTVTVPQPAQASDTSGASSSSPSGPGAPATKKVFIQDSASPEDHVLGVWENMVTGTTAAQHIFLLAYGNGGHLAKDVVLRQMFMSRERDDDTVTRLRGIACIESSVILESDDAQDAREFVMDRFLGWEMSPHQPGMRLANSESKLGCTVLSVGSMAEDEVSNVAWSVHRATDAVFRFFDFSIARAPAKSPMARDFAREEAKVHNLDPANAVTALDSGDGASSSTNGSANDAQSPAGPNKNRKGSTGIFGGIFRSMVSSNRAEESSSIGEHQMDSKLAVSDFDLLKVVGKGAFGKVMLVRKRHGSDKGSIYAMKVLKKSMIAAKGQVEHTKAERSILCEIHHPFIVCLRYAFQSEEKLYLITDYYCGGSLFYHLRKSRGFSEKRARFYAAELLLALSHLHDHHIIYRDLKLENVLMDDLGHIALTDFGLSKNQVDDVFENQLTTFCGTAEYIAPELLKGQKYGAAVDWWSFGVLLYEMMGFKTPFFDKNRKLMFYAIINHEPNWLPHFSAVRFHLLTIC